MSTAMRLIQLASTANNPAPETTREVIASELGGSLFPARNLAIDLGWFRR